MKINNIICLLIAFSIGIFVGQWLTLQYGLGNLHKLILNSQDEVYRKKNTIIPETCHLRRYGGSKFDDIGARHTCFENMSSGVIYSFGIGNDISFEKQILKRNEGVKLYAFDPTLSVEKVTKLFGVEKLPKNFIFRAIGIHSYDGSAYFSRTNSTIKKKTTRNCYEIIYYYVYARS